MRCRSKSFKRDRICFFRIFRSDSSAKSPCQALGREESVEILNRFSRLDTNDIQILTRELGGEANLVNAIVLMLHHRKAMYAVRIPGMDGKPYFHKLQALAADESDKV